MQTPTDDTSVAPAPTLFAPGERLSREELAPKVKAVVEDPIVVAILKSIPGSVLIVSRERQILAANREILDALGLSDADFLIGQRPGEALGCIHAGEGPSGCGTSRHCRVCGAVIAMLAALDTHEPYKGECTLSLLTGERLHCMNFAVHAVPLEIMGQMCLELVFHDIGDKKLREAMDRVFLHDLRNAMTGLYGWSELLTLKGGDGEEASHLMRLSHSVMEMIETQSCILHAETGDLSPRISETSVSEVFSELQATIESAPFARNGEFSLTLPPELENATLCTDAGLLNRVLVNMVKNGFEAIRRGQLVTLSVGRGGDGRLTFSVHNPGLIPEETQLSIFQRAFSTKGGTGRGFGTYSMKLLGQNVLKGEVGFASTQEEGTTFHITLPRIGEN